MLVRGVLRHWWQILLLWIVGSVAAAGFVYVKFKPSYEAISLLRIEPVKADPFSVASHHDESFLETLVQLITSTNVLQTAALDPRVTGFPIIRLSPDVVAALREAMVVRIVPGSNLIRVSMSSSSSEEAAGVVNAVVDAFLGADGEWSKSVNAEQIKRLAEFHDQLKKQVDDKQKQWMTLAESGNFEPVSTAVEAAGAPASRLSVTIDEYRQIREQLVTVNINLVEAEAHLESRRREQAARDRAQAQAASVAPRGAASPIEWQLQQDGDLAALRAQIDEANRQVAAASRLARNPQGEVSVRRFQANVRALSEQYARIRAEKLEQIRQLGNPAGQPVTVAAQADLRWRRRSGGSMPCGPRRHAWSRCWRSST